MEKQSEKSMQRFHMLDTLRGVMIIGVVISHFLFDMYAEGAVWAEQLMENSVVNVVCIIGRILFVFLAGICCRLSRNNLKRGLLVLAVAAVISIATFAMDLLFFKQLGNMFIYMGILHLLGVCMLMYAGGEKLLGLAKAKRIPDAANIALAVFLMLLFAVTYNLSEKGTIGIGGWSFPLHFPQSIPNAMLGLSKYEPLISADSFPLIGWGFAFFSGALIGRYFKEDRVPAFLHKNICPPVTFIGRKTLWIYLLHQPLVYGIALAVCYITR